MVAAEPFLGLDLASTGPVFLTILAVHVASALVAVVAGLIAMLSRKEAGRHPIAGRTYFAAVVVVFVSACGLAAFRVPDDLPLILAGFVAAASATYGFLFRRLHRPGDVPHIVAMALSYVALLTAFYVDNGPHLPVWQLLPHWSFWILPAVVGIPLTIRAVRRTQRARSEHAPPATRL
jgi:hypothetical protein